MVSSHREGKGEDYVVIPLRKPPDEVVREARLDKEGYNKK